MKKCTVLLLIAAIFIGVLPMSVFAESTFDKELEAVILKTKELFNIQDTYDNFRSHVSSSGKNVYFYMSWSDSNNKLDSINVTTDAKGNLISFNKYSPVYKQPETKLPNYTRDEALKFAKEFIGKMDKEIYSEIELMENNYPISSYDVDYNYTFIRVINGIPYDDNTVNISVNKYTGEVSNYYAAWDRELEFPEPTDIISLEDGRKAFTNQIGLDLMYRTSYKLLRGIDLGNEANYYLAYSLMDSNKAIDAFTGEVIDLANYGSIYIYAEEKAADLNSASGGGVITPEERAEIDKLSGIISIEEIEKEARKILNLDEDYVLQSRSLFSSYKNPGEYQWSLYFSNKVENESYSVNITLNAKTKELISFYKYMNYDSNAKAAISKADAMEIAKNFVKKQQPGKVEQVELINENLKEGLLSYYFRFIRKVDGIYVEPDSINVTVDTVNKEVTAYNLDWYTGILPPLGEIIDINKAYDILFNDIGFELNYAAIYDYELPEGENKEVKLVYGINKRKPVNIDAHSGKLLDYSGELYYENKILSYSDVEDSYAKDMINTLAEYRVGFAADEFRPKDKIKQKEFLYLLFKSINPWRDINEENMDEIYEELINSNVIKAEEKNLEKVVTKEEAVKFVIRAMKYDKVADIPNIYNDLFKDSKDISPKLKGYINIAYGLGIINGDGSGNISPKAELKREDAASIIYKYMFN